MRLPLLPVLALLLLAACSGQPPRPGVSTAPLGVLASQPPATVQARLETRLEELGFTLATNQGFIRAEIARGAPPEWFACDRLVVEDNDSDFNRFHWADPETHRIWLTARISELGDQTSIALVPHFQGIYRDRFNNLPFTQTCGSAGRLEPMLLAVAAG